MTEAWRAHDTRLGRDVAIKILLVEPLDDEERRGEFRGEPLSLSKLSHPDIAICRGHRAAVFDARRMRLREPPFSREKVRRAGSQRE